MIGYELQIAVFHAELTGEKEESAAARAPALACSLSD